jgi:two-component sensor histidine kinase
VLIDKTARIRGINAFAEAYTGKTGDQMVERLIGEAFDCDHFSKNSDCEARNCKRCVLRGTIKETAETNAEFHRLPLEMNLGAETRFWLVSTSAVKSAGEQLVLLYAEDVTSAKQSEKMILDSLKEKEILLREIHHRVKNNLSIINSLVSLQIQSCDKSEQAAFLKSLQNRIYSIAALHENLYLHDDLASIDTDDYIRSIINKVLSGISSGPAVHIDYMIEPITLSVDESLPVGIIINELVSNAVQHSGVDRNDLSISVQFFRDGGDVRLIVANSGRPFPAHIDMQNPSTLGLLLITGMVEQLKGSLEIDSSDTTRFNIVFPLAVPSGIISL